MFGWFKVGPKADFTKSKINFIDGALFGVPGMVRMNLAFSSDKMEEIVKRLNSVK
jgi:bifunctional pyridoxal-dependent enzyme with beta-cystathionase and maltose regulon repressor activities